MKINIISLADISNTIMQSLMLVLIPNYCIEQRYKNSKLKLLIFITFLFLIIIATTYLIGNSSLGTILTHLVLLISGILFFKEDSLSATITISIIYLVIIMNVFITSNLYLGIFQYKISSEHFSLGYVLSIYFPQLIMGIFILVKKDVIYRIYSSIKSKRFSIMTLIIMTVVADFIISFNFIIHDRDNPLFMNFLFLILGLFIIGITIYFSNIENKSKEINILNKELEEKINDLKKVKHDYGAQISYLYGMHLMGKYDRLGESLKAIINGHNNIISEVKISDNNSMITMIINGINHKGINIMVDEQALLEDANMSEMEIQRVISNILKNSITAMNEKGLITIKTYYNINSVVIKIQNNGPKIEKKIIDKIFDVGFTTKNDKNKDHGFGLAIVKELVEKQGGKVTVTSNDSITEFTINIPLKKFLNSLLY